MIDRTSSLRALQLLALFAWFAVVSAASAGEPSPVVRDEVRHLLVYMETSGCEFFRNGEWRSGAEAKDHLSQKYSYLLQKSLVQKSEDFIRLGATKSSVSGGPYKVRCKGSEPVPSAVWLTEELSRYRKDSPGKK